MGKKETLKKQLQSPDEEVRRFAIIGLAAYPFVEVKESIGAALGDGSWRVRKEAVDAFVAYSCDNDSIDMLVGMLASQDNAGLRNSAVEALERLGGIAVPVLSLHMDDDDHDVRKFIVDILGNIGDAAAVPLLIKALDDCDPNVSAAAAENLGKIADPHAVPYLVKSLAKNDLWLRFTILEALCRIGTAVPMDVLAPLTAERLLKKGVFDCIGAIGGGDAVPTLLQGLDEKVRNIRDAATTALIKVRDRLPADVASRSVDSKLRELKGSKVVEHLIASLDGADGETEEAILRVLGLIGDERAAIPLLHGCREERLRKHCLSALQEMGDAVIASLVDAFSSAGDEQRCAIAYVCSELPNAGCAPILRQGMQDDHPDVRKISVSAAGKAGLTALIDDIVRTLEDGEPEVRDAAVAALSRLAVEGREAMMRVAAALAGGKRPEKRHSAAMLFAALGDDEKLSFLIKDEDAMVRKAAVTSLAGMKSTAGMSHVIMALADEDADVRCAVACALGEIGGEDAIGPLLLALNDDDSWVKCAALRSLGRLGSKKALPAIVQAVETSHGLELIAALESVAEIGGENVSAIVEKALEDGDEEVVKAAIGILARGEDAAWIDEYADELISHAHWDVRRSFIKAMAAQRGAKALPRLQSALETESDPLVKETIAEVMDGLA